MSPPTADPVKLEVTLKYATVSEFDARFAANVASDTVFLKTPKPKPVGTVVALELHLAGGEIALAGHGPEQADQAVQLLGRPGRGQVSPCPQGPTAALDAPALARPARRGARGAG